MPSTSIFVRRPSSRSAPLAVVFRDGVEVRADPHGPDSERFPILVDLRAEGVTDYLALPLMFMDRAVHASSWTTKQPGGFTDKQLDAIRSLMAPLARYTEIVSLRRTATMLLDTYVGNSAGERILGGQIRRGHTETMQAAIWLSDLRGFTALSDRLPAETVVDILNCYFDCQVSAIKDHGGDVLKFMRCFRFPSRRGICGRSVRAFWRPRDKPVPASMRCNIGLGIRSSTSASQSRCTWESSCTAISAAATDSISPASALPSISPRGWKELRLA